MCAIFRKCYGGCNIRIQRDEKRAAKISNGGNVSSTVNIICKLFTEHINVTISKELSHHVWLRTAIRHCQTNFRKSKTKDHLFWIFWSAINSTNDKVDDDDDNDINKWLHVWNVILFIHFILLFSHSTSLRFIQLHATLSCWCFFVTGFLHSMKLTLHDMDALFLILGYVEA